jgi:hypothetical protein
VLGKGEREEIDIYEEDIEDEEQIVDGGRNTRTFDKYLRRVVHCHRVVIENTYVLFRAIL